MSVLACCRSDCDNVMCDRLILESSAYICNDCYKELLAYKETWPESMTPLDVREHIVNFMSTPTGTYKKKVVLDQEGIDNEFKRLTS